MQTKRPSRAWMPDGQATRRHRDSPGLPSFLASLLKDFSENLWMTDDIVKRNVMCIYDICWGMKRIKSCKTAGCNMCLKDIGPFCWPSMVPKLTWDCHATRGASRSPVQAAVRAGRSHGHMCNETLGMTGTFMETKSPGFCPVFWAKESKTRRLQP